jgi:hypothetical protein
MSSTNPTLHFISSMTALFALCAAYGVLTDHLQAKNGCRPLPGVDTPLDVALKYPGSLVETSKNTCMPGYEPVPAQK